MPMEGESKRRARGLENGPGPAQSRAGAPRRSCGRTVSLQLRSMSPLREFFRVLLTPSAIYRRRRHGALLLIQLEKRGGGKLAGHSIFYK